jgi:hypothetical protein
MTNSNRQIVRKSTLWEQGTEDDLRNTTAEEQLKMMWQLAVDAWAMKGVDVANQPMRKDVTRLIRLDEK